MRVLGLDVGGANLKAAHADGGPAVSRPFALWREPSRLAEALAEAVAACPPFDRLAVTMTGELCDCFAGKREGVAHVLGAVEAVAGGAGIDVWTNRGAFVGVERARADALAVASANWLAQAEFVARGLGGDGLLIDVGTTTTDVVPFAGGAAVPKGRTDPERLASGELIYRGWRRTPLCALLDGAAAELFATTHDACLALGLCPEDAADRDTADGGPATVIEAHRRLARMTCADLETSTPEERLSLARRALGRVEGAIRASLPGRIERLVTSGSGAFLLGRLTADFEGRVVPFGALAPGREAVACAHAVAVLRRGAG